MIGSTSASRRQLRSRLRYQLMLPVKPDVSKAETKTASSPFIFSADASRRHYLRISVVDMSTAVPTTAAGSRTELWAFEAAAHRTARKPCRLSEAVSGIVGAKQWVSSMLRARRIFDVLTSFSNGDSLDGADSFCREA